MMPERNRSFVLRIKDLVQEYVVAAFIGLMLAILVRGFILVPYKIKNDDLLPTFEAGEYLFANKASYMLFEPALGDLAVVTFPNDSTRDYLRRVVAVAGDKISIQQGVVVRNKKSAHERYLIEGKSSERYGERSFVVDWSNVPEEGRSLSEVEVPANHVFVLSDKRSNLQDSRTWGFVPYANLKGRLSLIWFSHDKGRIRWERTLQRIF